MKRWNGTKELEGWRGAAAQEQPWGGVAVACRVAIYGGAWTEGCTGRAASVCVVDSDPNRATEGRWADGWLAGWPCGVVASWLCRRGVPCGVLYI